MTEWQNVSSGDNERYLPSTCNDFESIKDESCVAFIDFIHSATLYGTNKRFSVVIIKEIPHIFEKYPNEFEQIILNVWFSNYWSHQNRVAIQSEQVQSINSKNIFTKTIKRHRIKSIH